MVVPDEGRVLGKIQLADGKPAIAFTIALGNTTPLAFAATDGAFAVSGVAGTHELTIAGHGFVTAHQQVTIAEGQDTDVGTLTVHPGRSISGRVLDEHGVPVAHATVAAGALLTGGGAELYIRRAEVVLGKTTTIEIDTAPGPVTLAVSVETDKGAPLPMGRVGAVALSIDPQTAEELRDGSHMPVGDQIIPMHGGVIQGGTATIEGLRRGVHTLCAMVGDPRVASSVKLECKQMVLTGAAHQSASLLVPAGWVEDH